MTRITNKIKGVIKMLEEPQDKSPELEGPEPQNFWVNFWSQKFAKGLKVIVIDEDEEDQFEEELEHEYKIGYEKDVEQINNLYSFIDYLGENQVMVNEPIDNELNLLIEENKFIYNAEDIQL